MKTCITFFEGLLKSIDLTITTDENYENKIRILEENNEYIPDKLFKKYLIYHNPYPFKSNVQNSVFHNYNGHVFVSHKNRDLNDDDLIFFKEYTKDVFKKGKGIYIESLPIKIVKQVKYKKPGALKIN